MYRLTSQKARTSQPRKPFFGQIVVIRIIIEVLPTLGHVAALLRSHLAMRDCKPVSTAPPLGAWCAAMPYRGRRGKVAGVLRWTKKVSRSVIGKKEKEKGENVVC